MFKYISSLYLFVILLLNSCESQKRVLIDGELKKWHKITLSFEGPETNEMDENNPFLNYRLDVTFKNGNNEFVIPGFYASDGNSAETSSSLGNIWQVRFTPDEIGKWTYVASFKKGKNIAVSDDSNEGSSAGFMDGVSGTFNVLPSDKTGIDNRAKGRLQYVGESYLKFAETNKYFIKLGVDAPENLLAYRDFDVSTNVLGFQKAWEPHSKDFDENAKQFCWQETKGKNLLGAINYLASEGLNVFSFLTFNVDGDDRNIFPHLLKVSIQEYEAYASVKKNTKAWETMFHKTRFDVSKLDQWERIFEYAETIGMFLHFKTHETETDHLMDNGVFGLESKLYYRELLARFGHHLSLNWNLGEENDQPLSEVKKAANYVSKLDAYDSHLVIHTFPNKDDRFTNLVGNQSPLTGASLQLSHPDFNDVHSRVLKWREKSNATGRKWAIAVDEPGKADIALLPDDEDVEHNFARSRALWGTLMAGGYGVEWYFGYASANSDLTCQDFRSRDLFWDQNRYALKFFNEYIPFWKMEPRDDLISHLMSYCLAIEEEIYVVYAESNADNIKLNIGASDKTFVVKWFDPRSGSNLQNGSITLVKANGVVHLGIPPNEPKEDWVVLVQQQ
ncbi:DUF5060 domain-containing protein [Cellulophaga tyrosinoxydans]|uniref:Putative collagen-binding domain of a collagenase n=1 Tax=Cellulophaga tyrosinoxydans TaxID=504486 RepID=A0A1W2C3I0_9FLAO|nr:DUF5060 domain-containing protein [Cellulophaga tyrosinoxydans]SMC79733.1 Putative collagen-binding domain of a collagenase [Cellulophaga tyrosinoxydans]